MNPDLNLSNPSSSKTCKLSVVVSNIDIVTAFSRIVNLLDILSMSLIVYRLWFFNLIDTSSACVVYAGIFTVPIRIASSISPPATGDSEDSPLETIKSPLEVKKSLSILFR